MSIHRLTPLDLLRMDKCNLDPLTENYDVGFYLNYLGKWPSLCQKIEDSRDGLVAYSMDPCA